MNKKTTLIFFVLLLFILGCNSLSRKTTKDIDLHIGFDGLILEFVKNTPPLKIFEGETFPVVLKVKNSGAYSIRNNEETKEEAILSLGVERDYTKSVKLLSGARIKPVTLDEPDSKIIDNAASFTLESKSKINLKGEEEIISYNVEAGKIDPQSEAHPSSVTANLCYPYQTKLETAVCIEPDISGLRPGRRVCKVQDLIFSQGQGAPIAVTKIEVNMLPTLAKAQDSQNEKMNIRPHFLIYIENKGKGTVIAKEEVKNFCTKSKTSHENLNKIYVKASLADLQLDCGIKEKEKKETYIKLKDNKELVRCVVKEEDSIEGTKDAYLSPLNIELNYGYSDSISANYFIQKVLKS